MAVAWAGAWACPGVGVGVGDPAGCVAEFAVFGCGCGVYEFGESFVYVGDADALVFFGCVDECFAYLVEGVV